MMPEPNSSLATAFLPVWVYTWGFAFTGIWINGDFLELFESAADVCFTTDRLASALCAMAVCLSVSPSQLGVLSKRHANNVQCVLWFSESKHLDEIPLGSITKYVTWEK